ncbi:MAG: GtrA family protein [Proteobacteria bacterium]|nr:GtrA family protein [Pseudomonadota bacterium]
MQWVTRLMRRYLSREQRRFVKFCVVGASGVPVNLLCTWLAFRFLGELLPGRSAVAIASLLGIALSIGTNFFLNDLWTWGDRRVSGAGRGDRLLRFYAVASAAASVQYGLAMALVMLLGWHYLLAQLGGIALAMLLNYVANHKWTFRVRREERSVSHGAETAALPAASARANSRR